MIIVNLSGGLGNQMFQYAFGQSLKKKRDTDVKYKTFFEGLINRKFELNHFNISGQIIGDEEFKLFKKNQDRFLIKSKSKFSRYFKKRIVEEKHYHFDRNLFSVPSNCIVEGYFQSEKYFVDIAEDIRKEFSFKAPLVGENKILSESITTQQSVSIHIRRGDYIANPIFPVYDMAYFQKAIDEILKEVGNPIFYIFSNDYEWCKKNIHLEYPHFFVSHNSEQQPYFDLYLMSLCKHNIVANSSFSWWAAWLNNNVSKKIISPYPWVKRTSSFFSNIEDIVPKLWTRVDLR